MTDAEILVTLLRAAQERIGTVQAELAAARLTRARLAALLADQYDMTHEEIARALPGMSRQRAGQLVAQGRLALATPVVTAGVEGVISDDTHPLPAPRSEDAAGSADGTARSLSGRRESDPGVTTNEGSRDQPFPARPGKGIARGTHPTRTQLPLFAGPDYDNLPGVGKTDMTSALLTSPQVAQVTGPGKLGDQGFHGESTLRAPAKSLP
ncbi:hypothetical protein HDA40_006113 [Hamadaea flava]|uniref:Uncharacterized protein n=1 Tax=Hamadaea flava TaxID=1742688 RepID=A0ABV8LW86_9ACTN|nr:hypothetical protein [Hamadaea flava]MCP2327606.1 hypothetical protein [Hamadaea flava]